MGSIFNVSGQKINCPLILYSASKYSIIRTSLKEIHPMRCEVKLYVAGTVFYEDVYAKNYQEAKEVALARNPNATVVSVNAK